MAGDLTYKQLNVHRFLPATRAEGPGWRSAVWVQGCSRHCQGCFASRTWSHEARLQMTPEDIVAQSMLDDRVEGITVMGGEPFEQPEALASLLALAWKAHLSTVVSTGYRIEELKMSADPAVHVALRHIDVLIDGPFILSEKDFSRPLAGSANQRFLFLTDRYALTDFPPNRIEVRIAADGSVVLNGMGSMEQLTKVLTQL